VIESFVMPVLIKNCCTKLKPYGEKMYAFSALKSKCSAAVQSKTMAYLQQANRWKVTEVGSTSTPER